MASTTLLIANLASRILLVRGLRILLDSDLASLYGVPVKALKQSVRRNLERFPDDFMFQLTWDEAAILRSRTVTLNKAAFGHSSRGAHFKYRPYAFTEQGVAMLSSVLRSSRAAAANIAIMRTFVRLRAMALASAEFGKKLDELESRVSGHDKAITGIVRAIRELAMPPQLKPGRRIGF